MPSSYLNRHPMLYLVLGFLILISLGTILLLMPFSSYTGLTFSNALFMATSAACVNGLAAISVGQELSFAGQLILLSLMEIGGIGIMAISTAIMLLVHSKMNFGQLSAFNSSYSTDDGSSTGYVIKRVAIITIAIEMCGTVLLFTQFADMPMGERIFYSVFHAVGAFCNTGFSLWNNSVQGFSANEVVNITFIFLIICGGFGFLSLSELFFFRKNKIPGKYLTLHTKLALLMTLLLIAAGTLLMLKMEWNGVLKGYSFFDKVLISVFQSVTVRSAGYSTVNFATLGVPMLFAMILFMFIGTNPGSCGGGIKTTTAAIIGLLGVNRFLGRKKTQVFNHTIPEETVSRAVRIFVLSVIFIAIACILLLHFETANLPAQAGQSRFLELLFETVSAFSTCGLSMGATENLTTAGKVLLSAVMFIGRLGPLVLIQAVVLRPNSDAYYSEENVMVG
jgi:trk system potassium uptake protein TrkH